MPWATPRDVAALGWLGEQFGAREDVTGEVLRRLSGGTLSTRSIRVVLSRWVAAGWAERVKVFGRTWVIPTAAGLTLAGPFEHWRPTLSRAAHLHAVNLLRLQAEQDQYGWTWTSERVLRQERDARAKAAGRRPGSSRRVPDATLTAPDSPIQAMPSLLRPHPFTPLDRPSRLLIECELHLKTPSRYRGIVWNYDSSQGDLVVWFTWPRLVEPLTKALTAAAEVASQSVTRWTVLALPEVEGLSYEDVP